MKGVGFVFLHVAFLSFAASASAQQGISPGVSTSVKKMDHFPASAKSPGDAQQAKQQDLPGVLAPLPSVGKSAAQSSGMTGTIHQPAIPGTVAVPPAGTSGMSGSAGLGAKQGGVHSPSMGGIPSPAQTDSMAGGPKGTPVPPGVLPSVPPALPGLASPGQAGAQPGVPGLNDRFQGGRMGMSDPGKDRGRQNNQGGNNFQMPGMPSNAGGGMWGGRNDNSGSNNSNAGSQTGFGGINFVTPSAGSDDKKTPGEADKPGSGSGAGSGGWAGAPMNTWTPVTGSSQDGKKDPNPSAGRDAGNSNHGHGGKPQNQNVGGHPNQNTNSGTKPESSGQQGTGGKPENAGQNTGGKPEGDGKGGKDSKATTMPREDGVGSVRGSGGMGMQMIRGRQSNQVRTEGDRQGPSARIEIDGLNVNPAEDVARGGVPQPIQSESGRISRPGER